MNWWSKKKVLIENNLPVERAVVDADADLREVFRKSRDIVLKRREDKQAADDAIICEENIKNLFAKILKFVAEQHDLNSREFLVSGRMLDTNDQEIKSVSELLIQRFDRFDIKVRLADSYLFVDVGSFLRALDKMSESVEPVLHQEGIYR
jgi:hypothetical protein